MFSLPPLSLYIHIPWCVRKCPYCDFNSHVTTEIPEDDYLSQLMLDLEADASFSRGRELVSIFIGGGTPSLMSADFYARLLAHVSTQLPIANRAEITLEANPGTFEAERFKGYREAGINRLSLGVQSFDDDCLSRLGRIHSSAEAKEAIIQLADAGFDNFNIDLMHGLPNQSLDMAMKDLETAIALGPTHLSWYQLTIEQNTEFYRYPPVLPKEEVLWDIQERGLQLLRAEGYGQYEISAHARPGYQSVHNNNYWTYGDYLGIGAGAHAKVTLAEAQVLRYRKTRLPADYLNCIGAFRRGEEQLDSNDIPFEFMMNALRLKEGVEESLFEERTGLSLSACNHNLQQLRRQGLVKEGRLATTERGFNYLNEVLEKLV